MFGRGGLAMSCSYAKGAWEVRWRDGNGRQRSRRFESEAPAQAFDEAIHDQQVKERKRRDYGQGGGVYPYQTADGTSWRCKVKRSDGTQTSKRGFTSRDGSARTPPTADREGGARRGQPHEGDLRRVLAALAGSGASPTSRQARGRAYESDGRLRLLPALESVPLGRMRASSTSTS